MKHQRGFSLLEVLIALIIVTSILAITIPRIQQGLELSLKTSTRKLSSSIRFAYFESVAKNKYFRLVFAIEGKNKDRYWLEFADRPVRIRSPEKEQEFEEHFRYLTTEEKDAILKREPRFIRVEENANDEIKIPTGIHFKDIYVEHQAGKIESGVAYLYFFPNGFTERAVFNLEDDEGHIYSIEVAPLTAKTNVRMGYWDYAENSTSLD